MTSQTLGTHSPAIIENETSGEGCDIKEAILNLVKSYEVVRRERPTARAAVAKRVLSKTELETDQKAR